MITPYSKQKPPAVAACDRSRTLLVDDEVAIVRAFRMILAASFPGLQIESAFNGQEAVERFGRSHPAVLVMDLQMPVMDGKAAFREIGRLCGLRHWAMPSVVFCTGYSAAGRMFEPLFGDPLRHCLLQKPVGWDDIVEAVRRRL